MLKASLYIFYLTLFFVKEKVRFPKHRPLFSVSLVTFMQKDMHLVARGYVERILWLLQAQSTTV